MPERRSPPASNGCSRNGCGIGRCRWSDAAVPLRWRGRCERKAAPSSREKTMTQPKVAKVVLAYSGGLDTSIILKWLEETYGCEIVTFTADLGQGEELGPAREKALAMGV